MRGISKAQHPASLFTRWQRVISGCLSCLFLVLPLAIVLAGSGVGVTEVRAETLPATLEEYIKSIADSLSTRIGEGDDYSNWEISMLAQVSGTVSNSINYTELIDSAEKRKKVFGDLISNVNSGKVDASSIQPLKDGGAIQDWSYTGILLNRNMYSDDMIIWDINEIWTKRVLDRLFNNVRVDESLDAFKERLSQVKSRIDKELFPDLSLAYLGLKVNKTVESNRKDNMISDAQEMIKRASTDLFISQSARIQAPRITITKTDNVLISGFTVGDERVYGSTQAFYTSVKAIYEFVSDPEYTTNLTEAKLTEAKEQLMLVADALNNQKSTMSGGGRCGNQSVGIGDWGALRFVLYGVICEVVTLVQKASLSLLKESINLVGTTGDISSMMGKVNSEEGFLSNLIPAEFSAKYLKDAVNNTGEEKKGKSFFPTLSGMHAVMLNLVNFLLLFFFIIVALANILQIDINQYALTKMFPGLVIGFIIAQFSFFSVRVLIEVTAATQNSGMELLKKMPKYNDINNVGSSFIKIVNQIGSVGGSPESPLTAPDGRPDINKIISQGFLNSFTLVAAFLMAAMAMLFAFRTLIMLFLVPFSGIAFFASQVPQLKSIIWDRWWKNFMSWLFMPLIATIWITLGFSWMMVTNTDRSGSDQTAAASLVGYLFGVTCLFIAIKTSRGAMAEAAEVVNKVQGYGKQAWGATGGAAGKAAWNATGGALGRNIAADAKAATGLIPGMGTFREWRKHVNESADTRRKAWSAGETMGSRRKLRQREETLDKREDDFTRQFDKDRKIITDKIKQKEIERKAASDAKAAPAVLERLSEEIKALKREDKDLEINLNDKIKEIKEIRSSTKGLSYSARANLRLNQQRERYHAEHAEHEQDQETAKAVAIRTLETGTGRNANKYRHAISETRDSKIYASKATQYARFVQEQNYETGKDHHGHVDEFKRRLRTGAETYSRTLAKVNDSRSQSVALIDAVENYSTPEPVLDENSTDEDRIRYEKWQLDEFEVKRVSRERASAIRANNTGRPGPREVEHSHEIAKYHDVSGMVANAKSPTEAQDIIEKRAKAAGHMARVYIRFRDLGARVSDDKIGFQVQDVKEEAQYFLELADGIGDQASVTKMEELLRICGLAHDGVLTQDQFREAKTVMANFASDISAPLMKRAELMTRDPHFAISGGGVGSEK